MGLTYWIVAGSYTLIILMAYLAHDDYWLTVRQMKVVGHEKGLPLIWHMGIWSNVFIVIPILGFITWHYSAQWGWQYWVMALIGGAVVSIFMHVAYANDKIPGALGGEGIITAAGIVHGVYMTLALAILILFYFATRGVEPKYAIPIMWLLMIHVVLGTHTVLKIVEPRWFPRMPVVDSPTAFVWGASAFALFLCTWWALR